MYVYTYIYIYIYIYYKHIIYTIILLTNIIDIITTNNHYLNIGISIIIINMGPIRIIHTNLNSELYLTANIYIYIYNTQRIYMYIYMYIYIYIYIYILSL